jgi:hypothetical protein
MTDKRRGPILGLRTGLVLLVMLVTVAVNVATAAPASAHADHSCSGATGSGYSCARASANGSNFDERLTYTYYNGSQRTFSRINFHHGRGAISLIQLCDSRAGDNIGHSLQIRDANGSVHGYHLLDGRPCRTINSGLSWLAKSYRVVTYSSGTFSHATVWCSACVPG